MNVPVPEPITLPSGRVMPGIDPTGGVGAVGRVVPKVVKPVAATISKAAYKAPEVIPLFRGSGKGIGNSTLVKGEYFADTEKFARTFGDVIARDQIPAGAKILDLDKIKKNPKAYGVDPTLLVDQNRLTKYILDNGFDLTRNTNSRGVEYVRLNRLENELLDLAAKSKDYTSFTRSLLENWDRYRPEIERIKAGMNPAQRMQSDVRQILWNRAQQMLQ